MTDKEKADCLIELHKEHMNHFKQTRDIEFKVNIALWTVIVLAGYYLDSEICLEWSNLCWYILVAAGIILCHLFLWLVPISRSEKFDLKCIKKYRKRIMELAEEKPIAYNKQTKNILHKRISYWIVFEVGITLLLLAILGVFWWL